MDVYARTKGDRHTFLTVNLWAMENPNSAVLLAWSNAQNRIEKLNKVSGFDLVQLKDVVLLEAQGNYTTFYIHNPRNPAGEYRTITTSHHLGYYKPFLHAGFLQPNRSMYVNFFHIAGNDHHILKLLHGTNEEIRITGSFKNSFLEQIDRIVSNDPYDLLRGQLSLF